MALKDKLAKLLYYTGISYLCFQTSKRLYGKHIRVINYHETPSSQAGNFERQLQFYHQHYCPVTYTDLVDFVLNKQWAKPKPGLIISFDDGKRNNYDVARPLLEKYGFTGWFFIPSGVIDLNNELQVQFLGNDTITINEYKGDRVLMSWNEIQKLTQQHVIGCHTMSHYRMNHSDTDEILNTEIVAAKKLLEEKSGKMNSIFCWVGGEEKHYTRQAALKIKEAGFAFSFMTNTYPFTFRQDPLQINRNNIETSYSFPLVLFQLSGLMDILYFPKRGRVNRLTAIQ